MSDEQARGAPLGQVGEQVGGVVGRDVFEQVGRLFVGQLAEQRGLVGGVHLLEGVGGDLVFEGLEDRRALLGGELVGDLGDVGGVQQRQVAARHRQAHGLGVARLQVDGAPVDQARLGVLGQTRGHAREADAPQDGAARDVDGDHAQRRPRAGELNVVHADHLAAVGVDDLPVEHLPGEEELVGLGVVLGERAEP